MNTLLQKLMGLAGALLAITTISAQIFAIDSSTFDSGGGTSLGGIFEVSGTLGPPEAAPMSGGLFSLTGEFLSLLPADLPPLVEPTTIFDNSGGSDNGGFGVNATTWLASRFCLGTQSYGLDSVSLLLNSQDFSGGAGPPCAVQFQIYASDPVTGKPSSSTGLIMNLSGKTNPITLLRGQEWVKWIPATPFRLSAGICYWAVLSAENGKRIGQIASFTKPTGDAASFGASSSADAGATWGTPTEASNNKMRIEATPGLSPPPIPERAADGTTAIPGGTGSFTGYPSGPSLSGDHLAFHGAGADGQQGVYVTVFGSPQSGTPHRIADMATSIPDGTGSFLSFGTESGIIIVSGNNTVFAGTGSGGQRGIYAAVLSPPEVGPPFRIADSATPIPGGSGNFTEFPGEPGVSDDHVVFAGTGSGGQQGVYGAAIAGSQSGPPFGIADTAAAIPGGTGNFTEFPVGPSVSGNHVVFAGNGADGQRGVYAAVLSPPQAGLPFRVADTTTAIPGGSGNFLSFGAEAGIIIVSGNTAVFGGTGSGGQQGIYAAAMAPPQVGPPSRVADTTTAIPGGRGNFTGFGEASISETDLAFLGMGTGGQTGIYDLTRGQLLKVIAVGDAIKGKRITGLKFSRSGLFGDPVAFQATFEDGSQGVYRIAVVAPPFELRISGVEPDGNDLRLSFNSLAGTHYTIQSRADLISGIWVQVPDITASGTGATLQLTIPNAFIQPPQFYRVQEVP